MKIIRCYIENFGKMHQFTYSFQDGLNMIEEENGWGKTTFAAFIKAMFYGLDYKQGKILTDRKRYLPWNGQKFGGYMIFESDGIQYKIERFFGKREKEDSFNLYDLSTNVLSDAFGKNLGEEIWKVDKDSYEKTAFITLEDSELLNDIISGKLGNIDEQEADMETSSKAINILDEAMAATKSKRGHGGKLEEIKNTIRTMKEDLETSNSSVKNIEKLWNYIEGQKRKLKEVKEALQTIDDKFAKFTLYEKRKNYDDIIKDYAAKAKDYQTVNDFFRGQVLSDSDMEKVIKQSNEYENQGKFVRENQMSEQEIALLKELNFQFAEGVPSLYELERCNSDITVLSNQNLKLRTSQLSEEDDKKLNKLAQKYASFNISISEIDQYLEDYNQAMNLEKEEGELKRKILIQENLKKESSRKTLLNPLLFIGIGVVLIGLFIMVFAMTAGMFCVVVGLLVALLSFFFKKKDTSKQSNHKDSQMQFLQDSIQEITAKKEMLQESYSAFFKAWGINQENIVLELSNMKMELSEYERIKAEHTRLAEERIEIKGQISETKKRIESFLGRYYNLNLLEDYERALASLRGKVTSYSELSGKSKVLQEADIKVKYAKAFLKQIFLHYYEVFPESTAETVEELRMNKILYARTKTDFKVIETKKAQYESQNDIKELENIILPDTDEDQLKKGLLSDKSNLESQREEIIKTINAYEKDISTHSIIADKAEDIESAIAQAEEECKILEKEYDLISKAKQCMAEAKEELATKYIQPMSEAFKKYLAEIEDKPIDEYQLDIRLNVRVESEGELHNSVELSKGMKDLIQICMRMALVEAVYKDVERPLLILDDPFVNLDNVRLNNATKLLKRISDNYQLVYFICHNSRSVCE